MARTSFSARHREGAAPWPLSASSRKREIAAKDPIVRFLLARAERLQRGLRNQQRVVGAVDDVQRRGRAHPLPHAFKEVERAERVARS